MRYYHLVVVYRWLLFDYYAFSNDILTFSYLLINSIAEVTNGSYDQRDFVHVCSDQFIANFVEIKKGDKQKSLELLVSIINIVYLSRRYYLNIKSYLISRIALNKCIQGVMAQ